MLNVLVISQTVALTFTALDVQLNEYAMFILWWSQTLSYFQLVVIRNDKTTEPLLQRWCPRADRVTPRDECGCRIIGSQDFQLP